MNYNTPWPKFVVTIQMPQCVRSCGLVFTSFDDCVTEYDLCNIIYTTEGGDDPFTLNPNALLEKMSTQVTDSSVWMFALIFSDDRIK